MNKNDIRLRIGFVLLPQFAMGAFAAFADLLGLLDAQTGTAGPCAWEVVAGTLIPVRSASGIQVVPTDLLGDPLRFDYVVVVGGPLPPAAEAGPALLAWLRQAARGGRHLVGLGNGVHVLARAGVLAGHRLCVGGDQYRDFADRFPAIPPERIVTDRPAVFDRRRITCAGGTAVTDVAVRILRRHLPQADIRRALRGLQIDAEGGRGGQIQPPPPGVPADSPPALRRAALVIEQYAGQIPSLGELADRLGLSPRQLQRLFRQHLDTTPQAYARGVRLRQAAWMLRHTGKSIAAIASDCGFSDAAHMGRVFRAEHGMAPGAWRRAGRGGRGGAGPEGPEDPGTGPGARGPGGQGPGRRDPQENTV
ncbi:GlxA family transcriptional regulator [Castellaniella defragrans]|uniref:GlxA family transcriptional regulator n=1 Tax=Castellaniella defragrans TaxID=75697 RepID=UPI002AFECB3F|nr:helix-turn-helix domain-containing protein [Castellaniella defragrans]